MNRKSVVILLLNLEGANVSLRHAACVRLNAFCGLSWLTLHAFSFFGRAARLGQGKLCPAHAPKLAFPFTLHLLHLSYH